MLATVSSMATNKRALDHAAIKAHDDGGSARFHLTARFAWPKETLLDSWSPGALMRAKPGLYHDVRGEGAKSSNK